MHFNVLQSYNTYAKSHEYSYLYNIHTELVSVLFLVAVIVPSIILLPLNGESAHCYLIMVQEY